MARWSIAFVLFAALLAFAFFSPILQAQVDQEPDQNQGVVPEVAQTDETVETVEIAEKTTDQTNESKDKEVHEEVNKDEKTQTGQQLEMHLNLEGDLVFSISQYDAKAFVDPGYSIGYSKELEEESEVSVNFVIPEGIRKGVVGEYEILYTAIDAKHGLKDTESRKVIVTDVDECTSKEHPHQCDSNSICRNTIGSYECDCKPGFEQVDERTCKDIDECRTNTHQCDSNSICRNTIGSYECDCKPGFERVDEHTCKDIDECLTGAHKCSKHATCTNTIGGYECKCNEDYEGDGFHCAPANICGLGKHNCDKNAHCVAKPEGGFDCICNEGYIGDGVSCEDIDECLLNRCPDHSTCVNMPGSFNCVCDEGFRKSWESRDSECIDINECVEGKHNCDAHATCINTEGSFTCECKEGYQGDGRSCVQSNPPKFTLNEIDYSINQYDRYHEKSVTIIDERKADFTVNTIIPRQLQKPNVEACGQFNVTYTVSGRTHDELIGEATAVRKVIVKPTNRCNLPAEHPWHLVCDPSADCVFEPEKCLTTCQCPDGYEGDGQTCVDRLPPYFIVEIPDPYVIEKCVVCSYQVDLVEDPEDPKLLLGRIRVQDWAPHGQPPIDLTDRVQVTITHNNDKNNTIYYHTFSVVDDAGNQANYTHTIKFNVNDLRKLIDQVRQLVDDTNKEKEQSMQKTAKRYFLWVVILLTSTLAGYFVFHNFTAISLLIRILFGHEATWEEYNAAMTFWYGLIHPLYTPQQRSLMIYSEYFNQDDKEN